MINCISTILLAWALHLIIQTQQIIIVVTIKAIPRVGPTENQNWPGGGVDEGGLGESGLGGGLGAGELGGELVREFGGLIGERLGI